MMPDQDPTPTRNIPPLFAFLFAFLFRPSRDPGA